MATLQNLVLKDRATTPVDHTFTPDDVVGGVGKVVESNGTKVGDSSYTIGKRKSGTGRQNVKLKLTVPVVQSEVINGISSPKIVRTAYATVDFSFAAESTTAERNNLVGMLQDSLAPTKTLVHKTVVDLEGVWG